MTSFDCLAAIAADPMPDLTARQIIERRLGRALPATADLPNDLRTAIKLLAVQKIKARATK